MRDKLKELYAGADITIVGGKGGVFEIFLENKVIFSMNILSRFPNDEDLQNLNIDANLHN